MTRSYQVLFINKINGVALLEMHLDELKCVFQIFTNVTRKGQCSRMQYGRSLGLSAGPAKLVDALIRDLKRATPSLAHTTYTLLRTVRT